MPIVLHPALCDHIGRVTAKERKQTQIKMAALRVVAGLETRSLRELAKELDCHHNAIANSMERICAAIGIRRHRTPDATRRRQSVARRRYLAASAA